MSNMTTEVREFCRMLRLTYIRDNFETISADARLSKAQYNIARSSRFPSRTALRRNRTPHEQWHYTPYQ